MSLHEAVLSGRKDRVKRLLEEGDDPDQRVRFQETPLHHTAKRDAHGIAALLIDHGATIDAKDYQGSTPLHHAASLGARKVVALLLARGANPAARNSYKDTPLHECAARLDQVAVPIAKALIAAGSPIDAKNLSGRTALWNASAGGNIGLVRALLALDANPRLRASGEQGTALDAARLFEQPAVIAVLEKHVKRMLAAR